MPTNAQAALQAAATVYAAGNYSGPATLTTTAAQFKAWLDKQDAAEPEQIPQRDTQLDALVDMAPPTSPPELHQDFRSEPLYHRGQAIGFTRR